MPQEQPTSPQSAASPLADTATPPSPEDLTPPPPARVYLDHAATTPLHPVAAQAMEPWLHSGVVGNASSVHAEGRKARAAVEDARDQIAAALNVHPLDVVFTSGGSEADNLAVKGLSWARQQHNPIEGYGVAASTIEHPAVLDAVNWLGSKGTPTYAIPVNALGEVEPGAITELLTEADQNLGVVALMSANNEIGTLQDLEQLVPPLIERNIAVHIDAVQSIGYHEIDMATLGITSMAISGHKLGGPIGVGALVVRRDATIEGLIHGGGQERELRSGTLPVANIVGFGAAVERAVRNRRSEAIRLRTLQDRLAAVLVDLPGVTINGHRKRRLPNNLHLSVAGADAEALLLSLDRAEVAASAGSACQSGATKQSHVMAAIGAPADAAPLRLSMGWTTTNEEITVVIALLRSLLGGGW